MSEGTEVTEGTETLTNGETECNGDETERQGWLCESGSLAPRDARRSERIGGRS